MQTSSCGFTSSNQEMYDHLNESILSVLFLVIAHTYHPEDKSLCFGGMRITPEVVSPIFTFSGTKGVIFLIAVLVRFSVCVSFVLSSLGNVVWKCVCFSVYLSRFFLLFSSASLRLCLSVFLSDCLSLCVSVTDCLSVFLSFGLADYRNQPKRNTLNC